MSWKKVRADKVNFPFVWCNEAQTTTTGPHVCEKKKGKKEKSATEALHMKWPAKIHISKQRDFKIQKKLVAWKSLRKAAN